MDKIALRCPGFTTANRLLRTSDNYIWRRIIEFRVGDSRVAVAIPMTGDGEFADGVMLDRSPAAYIADGATEVTAKVVLVALARVMHR
jgi:hypothetical protein